MSKRQGWQFQNVQVGLAPEYTPAIEYDNSIIIEEQSIIGRSLVIASFAVSAAIFGWLWLKRGV